MAYNQHDNFQNQPYQEGQGGSPFQPLNAQEPAQQATAAVSKSAFAGLSKGVIALFAAAIALLLVSGVGTAQAALTYFSDVYSAQLATTSSTANIGIVLNENGEGVVWRDYTGTEEEWNEGSNNPGDVASGILAQNLVPEGQAVMPGRTYPESLTVSNSGSIEQYVRVKLSRYWLGPDGKQTTLSPSLIKLGMTQNSGWIEDVQARETEGRVESSIYYYTPMMMPGATSRPFVDSVTIDKAVASKVDTQVVSTEDGYTNVTATYQYNNYQFVIEAEVDAVQGHNAVDAIKSAWGVDVTVDDSGNLALQ